MTLRALGLVVKIANPGTAKVGVVGLCLRHRRRHRRRPAGVASFAEIAKHEGKVERHRAKKRFLIQLNALSNRVEYYATLHKT